MIMGDDSCGSHEHGQTSSTIILDFGLFLKEGHLGDGVCTCVSKSWGTVHTFFEREKRNEGIRRAVFKNLEDLGGD